MRAKEFITEWTLSGVADSVADKAGEALDWTKDTFDPRPIPRKVKSVGKNLYRNAKHNLKKYAWAVANPLDAIDYGEHERDYWMDTPAGLKKLKKQPWLDPQYTKEHRRKLLSMRDNYLAQQIKDNASELKDPESTSNDAKRDSRITRRTSRILEK
jgi:hypothetical protein